MDEADGPDLGGVKRDLVVIVFVMQMDGRHQMWVLHGVYDEVGLEQRLAAGARACQAQRKSVRLRCPSVLPSPPLAPSFTHLPIYRLSRHSSARPNRLFRLFCLVKPILQPRHLTARALANINKAAPSASSPPIHTRRAVAYSEPLFTSSITAATLQHVQRR